MNFNDYLKSKEQAKKTDAVKKDDLTIDDKERNTKTHLVDRSKKRITTQEPNKNKIEKVNIKIPPHGAGKPTKTIG